MSFLRVAFLREVVCVFSDILLQQEKLDFYKLELSNRETNFNKIFNSRPIVGTVKPIGELNPPPQKRPTVRIGEQ